MKEWYDFHLGKRFSIDRLQTTNLFATPIAHPGTHAFFLQIPCSYFPNNHQT